VPDDHSPPTVEVEELTDAEAWAIFDAGARRTLGMTGAEFERKWRAGELAHSHDPQVTRVAMLLPGAWT
jgi:hypothetical protein